MVDYNVRNKYYCDCTNLKSKRDCLQFYQYGYHIDGVYQVTMNGFANRLVYCDQTNNNGGWTVIQIRYDILLVNYLFTFTCFEKCLALLVER